MTRHGRDGGSADPGAFRPPSVVPTAGGNACQTRDLAQLRFPLATGCTFQGDVSCSAPTRVEVEFDFGVTTSGKGGVDFTIWSVGAKAIAGIKHEETQRLILSFGAP
jgi:Trypsin-co-occurring domain 2